MTVYGIQFWIECKGGLKTAYELSDVLDDLVYDGNLRLRYSNRSIMGAGLFMKNAVQNNFESIREILNEFADKIKYVSEWDYEDSNDIKWGVHTFGESKKSNRKSLKESMNLNYEDFDYDEFVKYICNNLTDVTPKDIQIICDKYDFDVEIDYGYEDADSVSKWLKYDSEYNEFIFGELESRGVICLKMPIIRAKKIADNFKAKLLKTEDADRNGYSNAYIGDKNSDVKFWINIWFEEEDGEKYPYWDWNQDIFSTNDYNDCVMRYLQQDENMFYEVDDIIGDIF